MSRIPDAEVAADAGAMRNNLHRTLNNNLNMAGGFAVLARLVHTASNVPHRTRELAILRIASALKSDVEWGQHFRIAQMVGVSVEEARAIRDGDLTMFSEADRAAIVFAEAVEQCRVSEDVWTAAANHYSPVQLLDLAMVAGFYGYASRITLALGVKIDEGLSKIADS